MAYADHSQTSSRTISIVIVALLHVVLGYAFVTGLGMKYVKKAAEQLDVFDVKEEPPPPDEPPPPPPKPTDVPPPPVVSPPKIVEMPAPAAPVMPTAPKPVPLPPLPPAPTAPPAPTISKAAGAKGDPAQWVTSDDYPDSALRKGAEGRTGIAWDINVEGRVENCRVTSSSGNSDLDQAACRAITRRGRYKPALDQNGSPLRSSQSRTVVWKIPQ